MNASVVSFVEFGLRLSILFLRVESFEKIGAGMRFFHILHSKVLILQHYIQHHQHFILTTQEKSLHISLIVRTTSPLEYARPLSTLESIPAQTRYHPSLSLITLFHPGNLSARQDHSPSRSGPHSR